MGFREKMWEEVNKARTTEEDLVQKVWEEVQKSAKRLVLAYATEVSVEFHTDEIRVVVFDGFRARSMNPLGEFAKVSVSTQNALKKVLEQEGFCQNKNWRYIWTLKL